MYNSIFRAAKAYWALTNSEKNNALSRFKCMRGETQVVYGKANNQGNTKDKDKDDKEGDMEEAIIENACEGRWVLIPNKKDKFGCTQRVKVHDCNRCSRLWKWKEKFDAGKARKKVLVERSRSWEKDYKAYRIKNPDAKDDWGGKPNGVKRKSPPMKFDRKPRTQTNSKAFDKVNVRKEKSSENVKDSKKGAEKKSSKNDKDRKKGGKKNDQVENT